MRLKKYIPIILGTMVIALSGCGKDDKINKQIVTVKKYDKTIYEAVNVEKGDIVPELTITLQADTFSRKSYFPLYDDIEVASVNVSTGERVKEGDVLITFKSENIEDKIDEHQQEIDQNKLLIEHYRKLSQLDDSVDYSIDIEQLTRSVEIDNLYISELKAKMDSYSIIAEGNGMVNAMSDILNYGKVGTDNNLITIIYGDETFTAETEEDYDFQIDQVYQAYYGASNYNVRITDIVVEGKKKKISFKIDSDDASFCSRDTLYLTVNKPTLKDVIYVPEECVNTVEGKTFVYLLDENGYRDVRDVVVGSTVGDFTIIESGISEGDRVVIK